MSILSRLRAPRSPDDACARALFAGRRLPPGAPASQQALARLLEAAAAPGTARELTGEVAAAAAFVQVTSQPRRRSRTGRMLAAAACAVAVAGIAVYASVLPSPHHKIVPVPFGVPAAHHAQPSFGVPATRGTTHLPFRAGAANHTAPAQVATRVPPRPPRREHARPKGRAAWKARCAAGQAAALHGGGR